MSDKLDDGYGGTLTRKFEEAMKREGRSESVTPPGSPNWLCPFCKQPCDVGWDCGCGAKAVNSAFWFVADRPLMSHANIGDAGLLMRVISNTLDAGLREMIH